MRVTVLCLFFNTLISSILFSQADFKSGYIITSKGDSLNYLIKYKPRSSNLLAITDLGNRNDPKEFNANEIIAFGLLNGDR